MKRAKDEDQKARRREAILAAAAARLGAVGYESLNLGAVAGDLGLVKGTLYRYFRTKESLVLGVLEAELEGWAQALAALGHPVGLEGQGGRAGSGPPGSGRPEPAPERPTPGGLARAVAADLARRPLLVQLLGRLHVVLEKNLDLERLARFKGWLAELVARAGASLEAQAPFLAGRGPAAVLALYELVLGVGALTERSPAVEEVLNRPGFESLRFDFTAELSRTLTWTWTGLASDRV